MSDDLIYNSPQDYERAMNEKARQERIDERQLKEDERHASNLIGRAETHESRGNSRKAAKNAQEVLEKYSHTYVKNQAQSMLDRNQDQ
jgi:hypothetical protein